jgi:hypothetical protein
MNVWHVSECEIARITCCAPLPGTYWLVGWLMALMCHGDVGTRPACWTTINTASDGQCVSCGLPHVYIRVKMGRSAHLMFTDAAGRCATRSTELISPCAAPAASDRRRWIADLSDAVFTSFLA